MKYSLALTLIAVLGTSYIKADVDTALVEQMGQLRSAVITEDWESMRSLLDRDMVRTRLVDAVERRDIDALYDALELPTGEEAFNVIFNHGELLHHVNDSLEQLADKSDYLLDREYTVVRHSLGTALMSFGGKLTSMMMIMFSYGGLLIPIKIFDRASRGDRGNPQFFSGDAIYGVYRLDLHYRAYNISTGDVRTNSCSLFIASNFQQYEIDACADEDIFPQDDPGHLRIRSAQGLLDLWDFGQKNVVANRELENPLDWY